MIIQFYNMIINNSLNRYTNALIKEFNNSSLEMCINVDSHLMRFIPNKYGFKRMREIFKEISLFPVKDNKRISFKDIEPKELLECIKRFKEWANLNGFEWKSDQEEWERLCKLYE